VDSVVEAIVADVRSMFSQWGDDVLDAERVEMMRRFMAMVEANPSLRAAEREASERMIRLAAEILAVRAGISPEDPEPQMAAVTLAGLWRIARRSLERHCATRLDDASRDAVIADVRRAGRLIDTGLWCLGALSVDARHDQLRVAARSAEAACAHVVHAVRQARNAWRAVSEAAESRRP
jgi:hypothetical protein